MWANGRCCCVNIAMAVKKKKKTFRHSIYKHCSDKVNWYEVILLLLILLNLLCCIHMQIKEICFDLHIMSVEPTWQLGKKNLRASSHQESYTNVLCIPVLRFMPIHFVWDESYWTTPKAVHALLWKKALQPDCMVLLHFCGGKRTAFATCWTVVKLTFFGCRSAEPYADVF